MEYSELEAAWEAQKRLQSRFVYTAPPQSLEAQQARQEGAFVRPSQVDAVQQQILAQVDFENMQPPANAQPNIEVTTPLGFDQHHLPADARGTWVEGPKGNGVFEYSDTPLNRLKGLVGTRVRYENGYIAQGGFPPSWYYGGNAATATVNVPVVKGTNADFVAADAEMLKRNPKWVRPSEYTWNHAGPPGSTTMELVLKSEHKATAHEGNAQGARAALRSAKANGAAQGTARAMAALVVYETLRDALQASGTLQPSYVELTGVYYFGEDDGSVFYVKMPGWLGVFSSPTKEYVAGPKMGQSEEITTQRVDEYRIEAEKFYGKYLPGNIFTAPRFIGGSKRARLPVYEGLLEVGYVDGDGVHYYPLFDPHHLRHGT